MNTRINYLYRDASNYKRYNSAIVEGEITQDDLKRIAKCMDGEYFIPRQVGLSEERIVEDYRTDDDHAWFEWEMATDDNDNIIVEESVEFTKEEPDVDLTVEELVANFEAVIAWDEESWEDDYEYMSYEDLEKAGIM